MSLILVIRSHIDIVVWTRSRNLARPRDSRTNLIERSFSNWYLSSFCYSCETYSVLLVTYTWNNYGWHILYLLNIKPYHFFFEHISFSGPYFILTMLQALISPWLLQQHIYLSLSFQYVSHAYEFYFSYFFIMFFS